MGMYFDQSGCGCYFLSVTMTSFYCCMEHENEAAWARYALLVERGF